ncbi:response regulator [Cryptosporangium phraense]|uniref:Transcriptional regulatory protein n=1 Tax=Cryptosporangium phraense TaxID=2593070 RepID=A0A545ARY8_9ACTN|nr:response regulator [Cryptosporangium phraense]TQS44011.1 response regulator [Cryptosporangium phraense]
MIRVLVVDDDYRVAELHARYVRETPGFGVVGVAHSGAEALAAVPGARPHLVLLDQYLPDAFGTRLVADLGCDVLMLTAAGDVATVREALTRGVVNYLVKPFTQAALAERLRAYARYRDHLRGDRTLDQREIDRAVRLMRGGDRLDAGLPKGRSEHTARLVTTAVREAGVPVSAADVATETGISRATAQRYLSDLAADGRIVMTLRYGSTGRPEHRYAWRG